MGATAVPGRHASSDMRRFRRDLIRLIVIALSLVVLAAVVVVSVRQVTGESEEGDAVAVSETGPSSTATRPATMATSAVATTPPSTAPAAPSTAPSTSTTTTAPPSTTTLPPVRGPAQITVLVLNSTRVTGLAGRVTERLSALGYRTEPPANHTSRLDTSVVWYVEGFDREAEILAEEIPDANLEPFPGEAPGAHLTVVVGESYRE